MPTNLNLDNAIHYHMLQAFQKSPGSIVFLHSIPTKLEHVIQDAYKSLGLLQMAKSF